MEFPDCYGLGGDANAALLARQDTRIFGAYRAVHGERIASSGVRIMLD
jgi:hypothetical protein